MNDEHEHPPEKDKKESGLILVGIGASAGGLEALKQLLPKLPSGCEMAYVIVQHLAPNHRSMLVSLLKRETSMEVEEVRDKLTPQPDHIYITPSNSDVFFSDGVLRLKAPEATIGPKPSVDSFFTTMAEGLGVNSIGIILSGTGSDGSHGVRAIKGAGGFVLVQTPESAKYDGMPTSAIDTGCVDLIMSPEEIALELPKVPGYSRSDGVIRNDEQSTNYLGRIFQILKHRTSHDFSNYKPTTLCRRIERRIAVHKLDGLESYVQYLENSPREASLLYKDILISVTSFFRDLDAFKALDSHLPALLEKKPPGANIRIWIPGCATGEEAYTIAIMVSDYLGDRIADYRVQIFATDIDEDATNFARKGLYSEAAIAEIPEETRERYFESSGKNYLVKKSLRDMLVFAKHDLIKDSPFSKIDLVTCRNLLIYFNSSLQQRVFQIFHYILNPGALLFLGKSESIGQNEDMFEIVDNKYKVFRRRGAPRQSSIDGMKDYIVNYPKNTFRLGETPPKNKSISLSELYDKTAVSEFVPNGVIVDGNFTVRYIRGDVSSFFRLPQGDATLNLLKMAQGSLLMEIRSMVHKANREGQGQVSRPLRSDLIDGTDSDSENAFRIVVKPVEEIHDITGLFMVSFVPLKEHLASSGMDKNDSATSSRIAELEDELAASREHLQTVVEELETSNEELQSLNEELQSSNEELQSSNEELETSNEELQSTNEELITVNEELQVKSVELAQVNSDLNNVMNSLDFPLLVVDRDLKITRFTEACERIFKISADDIGHYLLSIPSHFDIPDLKEYLLRVMLKNQNLEIELRAGQHLYWLRMLPYLNERKQSNGVILMLLDRTEIFSMTKKLANTEKENNMIEEMAEVGSWRYDIKRKIFTLSSLAMNILGVTGDDRDCSLDTFLSFVHPDDFDLVSSSMSEVQAPEGKFRLQFKSKPEEGRASTIVMAGAYHPADKNEIAEVVGILVPLDNSSNQT